MLTWKQVNNPARRQPDAGTYTDWKEDIARDCGHQCVYCAIPEASFGGIDNFHVEHYRPKSKFPDLRETITNLYLACSICNRFKGNDWPEEPRDDHSVSSYPDPANHDYNGLFALVDGQLIEGHFAASKYVVERLFLNRKQLVTERRIVAVYEAIKAHQMCAGALINRIDELADDELKRVLVEYLALISKALVTYADMLRMRPYERRDVRRGSD
ncbi:HNH endonuclease [Verrucomicrobiota bacterium]